MPILSLPSDIMLLILESIRGLRSTLALLSTCRDLSLFFSENRGQICHILIQKIATRHKVLCQSLYQLDRLPSFSATKESVIAIIEKSEREEGTPKTNNDAAEIYDVYRKIASLRNLQPLSITLSMVFMHHIYSPRVCPFYGKENLKFQFAVVSRNLYRYACAHEVANSAAWLKYHIPKGWLLIHPHSALGWRTYGTKMVKLAEEVLEQEGCKEGAVDNLKVWAGTLLFNDQSVDYSTNLPSAWIS